MFLNLLTDAVDNSQSGDNIPGNIQTPSEILSPEATVVLILFFCMAVVLIVMLSIVIYRKNKEIKQLKDLICLPLTEKEQNLITNYRKLNQNGKAIVETECNNLTNNGATRKYENDGI